MQKSSSSEPSDRDQRAVRPSPTKLLHHLSLGSEVITKRGPGKVVDVTINIGGWEDGAVRLMPPLVSVELDEPWQGAIRVSIPLQHIRLKGDGAVFKEPCFELWPDQVPDKPARLLRPTTEPIVRLSQLAKRKKAMKLSELVREAQAIEAAKTCAKGSCQACKACLKKGEKWVCGKCHDEIKAYLGDMFPDPNGEQFWATVMRRLPLVRYNPYSW